MTASDEVAHHSCSVKIPRFFMQSSPMPAPRRVCVDARFVSHVCSSPEETEGQVLGIAIMMEEFAKTLRAELDSGKVREWHENATSTKPAVAEIDVGLVDRDTVYFNTIEIGPAPAETTITLGINGEPYERP